MSDFQREPEPTAEPGTQTLKPIIRLGDTSTHGGAVTSADTVVTVEGIFQARNNDEFTCDIELHNPATVGPGIMSVAVSGGMDVAKEGDITSCGATLFPSQFVVLTEDAMIRITSPSTGDSF